MKSRGIISLLAGLNILCGQHLCAQTLTITCSNDSINADQEFIVVLDGQLGNFKDFATLPDVHGLIVVSHHESFNYNSSNKNAVVHQSYVMKAISPGDYTIGPAWIQAGSRRLYSNTLHLHVSAGANPVGSGLVFMRCEPEKKTVYSGEKVNVALRIYFAEDYYVSGDYPMALSYSGFWKDDAGIDYDYYDIYDDTIVYIKGNRYTRRTLLNEVLYPNAVGDLKLPTYTYSCYISSDRNDVYSYDSYEQSFDLVSQEGVISSLPLPDHDSLPGFSGDVGQFKMRTTISAHSTREWEPVVYTMWITGDGNFQFMMPPTLTLPPGLRSLSIMNSDTTVWDGQKKSVGKMFRYLITPEKTGDYNLGSIAFSYFDPHVKEYITLNSDSFRLHVDPGVQIESDSVSNLPDTFFAKKEKNNRAIIFVVCSMLVIAPLLTFAVIRQKKKKRLEREAAEKELAEKKEIPEYVPPPDTSMQQANALLHGAGQYLQNGLILQSVNNLYEAFVIRIAGLTKMRREEISVNTLRYRLKLVKFNDDLINEVVAHYEDLKLKKYAISPADAASAHILIVRTADLIRKMQ